MNESTEPQQQFAIQKIYLKDASFESPAAPEAFGFKQWEPKIDVNLTNNQRHVGGDIYEAVLSVTATVTQEETIAFLAEVQQAGLFQIVGFEDDQKQYLLASQCMNVLFPYVREAVSDMSVRGGFPPLFLSQVNFDVLYQQHLQKKQPPQDETDDQQHLQKKQPPQDETGDQQ